MRFFAAVIVVIYGIKRCVVHDIVLDKHIGFAL